LASGNTAVATVPASVTVVAGVSSANFTVQTRTVVANIRGDHFGCGWGCHEENEFDRDPVIGLVAGTRDFVAAIVSITDQRRFLLSRIIDPS